VNLLGIPINAPNNEIWQQVSDPDKHGIKSTKIDQIVKWIDKHSVAVDSLLIVSNGELVVEKHLSFDENLNQLLSDRDKKHLIASCTKSITSALIGIAIDKGYIKNIYEKVLDFFPDYLDTIDNLDSRKEMMTIEDLLTMRTGLDWYQPGSLSSDYFNTEADHSQMYNSPDYIAYTLSQPMTSTPGTGFAYCGGASHLLSAIIERTSGKSTLAFAQEYLFRPLGITDVYWPKASEGTYIGGGGVRMTARDMAKFGYLYLNNGSWNGDQIVSKEWVINSTKTHHLFRENMGYGYQWWTYPQTGVYAAFGAYCQKIFIIPEQNIVVVFTANIMNPPDPEFGLLLHILSSSDNYQTFSGYGLKLNYTTGMIPDERTDIVGPVTNLSGRIDINTHTWPLLKYTIEWDTMETSSDLNELMENYLTNFKIRNPAISVVRKGSVITSLKDNHEMVYQEFKMIEQGTDIWGIISYLVKNFENYVSSVSCH
jgi:CubicO group peptidase (beta-lactamase class C family)